MKSTGKDSLCRNYKNFKNIIKEEDDFPLSKRIYILDCDARKTPCDFADKIFLRVLNYNEMSLISKGIENLFSPGTLHEAERNNIRFDQEVSRKSQTGKIGEIARLKWDIEKQEKPKLCNWICENGKSDDFFRFQRILDEIAKIIGLG